MKGKREVKGWITRNGVHIPVYGDYTVQPKPPKAKMKGQKRFRTSTQVYHRDREGWQIELTDRGEIKVGYDNQPLDYRTQYYKNTPENMAEALDYWKSNSMAREVKLPGHEKEKLAKWIKNKDVGRFGRWEPVYEEKKKKGRKSK